MTWHYTKTRENSQNSTDRCDNSLYRFENDKYFQRRELTKVKAGF